MIVLILMSCEREVVSTPTNPDTAPPADTAVDTAPPSDTAPPVDTSDTGEAEDADGDGYPVGQDCDDQDEAVHPGAVELCNGLDENCDAVLEEDLDSDGALDCLRCESAGYWGITATVENESALLKALDTLYIDDACKDYSAARELLFLTLDNHKGTVEGLYTGAIFTVEDTLPDWDVVNTEHVWPRSAGAAEVPRECDLHHLFPTDASVNNRRGSLPFGEVLTATWSSGGSQIGLNASGDEVFEPRDEKKGDVARAMFYFSMRYPDKADTAVQRTAEQVEVFQQWHQDDPPDAAEQGRSQQIAVEQGWDNPFVVCPELTEVL
ncbi:MAG: deoxyribonuclease-1 [Myxococcota bacterium]